MWAACLGEGLRYISLVALAGVAGLVLLVAGRD
jgi:hypothetical protein